MAKKKKKPAKGKSTRGRAGGDMGPLEFPLSIPPAILKGMLDDPDAPLNARQLAKFLELMTSQDPEDVLQELARHFGADLDDVLPGLDVLPDIQPATEAEALIKRGDDAIDPIESRAHYLQALEVAQRALPKKKRGSRSIATTQAGADYLTVLGRLANVEWFMRRRDEAAGRFEQMLSADPLDFACARIPYSALLQEQKNEAGFAALLERFPDDDGAHWAFHRALSAYQTEGDSPRARELLQAAGEINPYVAAYLTGASQPPEKDPDDDFDAGGPDEAVAYAKDFMKAWRTTAGAPAWVRQVLKPVSIEPAAPKPSRNRRIARLNGLPQADDEVWQLGVRRDFAAEKIESAEGPQFTAVLTSATDETLLGLEAFGGRPRLTDALDLLLQSMQSPMHGHRRRPAVLQLDNRRWADKLQRILAEAEIEVQLCPSLDVVDAMWAVSEAGVELINNRQPHSLEDLAALERDPSETWQAAVLKFPHFVDEGGHLRRPWMTLVLSASQQLARATAMYPDLPPDALWQSLAAAMLTPLAGSPLRPARIELTQGHDEVQQRLESLGIECLRRERLTTLDVFLDHLVDDTTEKDRLCPLVGVPGMRLEQVRSYFEAADEYYRLAPWNDISNEEPIKLECPKFESGTRYGIVMGQSGLTFGLSLHDDLRGLQEMLGDLPESVAVRRMSALSLNYSEEFEMAARDLMSAERYGWPVAAPEAWPLAMHISPGQAVRSPLAWELELLEGCVRAIPPFLRSGEQSLALEVPGAFGPLKITVSRVPRK